MVSPIELQPDPEFASRFGAKCLVGKVIHPYRLKEGDVTYSVSADWKCSKAFSVSTVGPNVFLFCFHDDRDLMQVLMNVPWNVKGGLLVLLPWNPNHAPKELDFSFSPFWIQVHGLPPSYLTRENGLKIGQTLGRFMYSDMNLPESRKLVERNFLRIRVVLDIRRSLLTGRWVKRVGLSDIWAEFRYENLGRFCYKCGRIGSTFSTCVYPEVKAKFGAWLSVPPCLNSPAPLMNTNTTTMLIEYSNLSEKVNDEKKNENDDSVDQILHDKEELSTRSHLKRMVMNTLDSAILIVNAAIVHGLVSDAAALEANFEVTENGRFFWENWKLFVLVAVYFAYLVWRLIRVARKSWLLKGWSGQNVGMSSGFMVVFLAMVCSSGLVKFA